MFELLLNELQRSKHIFYGEYYINFSFITTPEEFVFGVVEHAYKEIKHPK